MGTENLKALVVLLVRHLCRRAVGECGDVINSSLVHGKGVHLTFYHDHDRSFCDVAVIV